jgi:hypothetical protein
MAAKTVAGKFGGFLQVDADNTRLMTSQVSVLYPPQMSSFEKSLNQILNFRLGYVRLHKIR